MSFACNMCSATKRFHVLIFYQKAKKYDIKKNPFQLKGFSNIIAVVVVQTFLGRSEKEAFDIRGDYFTQQSINDVFKNGHGVLNSNQPWWMHNGFRIWRVRPGTIHPHYRLGAVKENTESGMSDKNLLLSQRGSSLYQPAPGYKLKRSERRSFTEQIRHLPL